LSETVSEGVGLKVCFNLNGNCRSLGFARDDKKERVDEKGRMDGRGEDGASSEDWLHESQVSEARPGAIVCC
jgi:hypothetical protein